MYAFVGLLGVMLGFLVYVSVSAIDWLSWSQVQPYAIAAVIVLAVLFSLFVLVFSQVKIRDKETGEEKPLGLPRAVFGAFSILFTPLTFLFSFPSKDLTYQCPRCFKTDAYEDWEQVDHGSVGAVVDNPAGPDFGFIRPVTSTERVFKCRSCATRMTVFESSRYRKWANSWTLVICTAISAVFFIVILPVLLDL